MPGDYDIEYTSPWAGANWLPMAPRGTPQVDYETISFHELWHLTHNVPEAGIHVQQAISYLREHDADPEKVLYSGNEFFLKDGWCKDLAPGFRELRKDELPEGFASGTTFQSMCINTQIYLPWLVAQCLKLGVKVKRGVLKHICEAADMHHSGKKADVVVNCTGLMARRLGGVMDESVYPARGQVVVVRNEAPAMFSTSSSEEPNEITYIMTRAAGKLLSR